MSVKWSQLKAIPTFALMLFVVVLTASACTGAGQATPLAASRTFPETGRTVSGTGAGADTSTPTAASTAVSATSTAVPNGTITPTLPADAESTLRQRPLTLPTIEPGQLCPTSAWRSIAQNLPPALGDGPIYAVGFAFDRDGILHLRSEQLTDGLYYEKMMWASSAEYDGPALVRGGQIDGPNEMRFQQYDGPVKADAWLDSRNSAGSPTGQPGWRGWPSYTVLRGPGCYAYQIDALPFTKILIFKAVDTP